jgi:hypothetical protein
MKWNKLDGNGKISTKNKLTKIKKPKYNLKIEIYIKDNLKMVICNMQVYIS